MKKWSVTWQSKSDIETACKLTATIALAIFAYIYHLAGWTMTVHYDGKIIFEIPELW